MGTKQLSLIAVGLLGALLSGCGSPEQPAAKAKVYEHGVFVSSSDCAASGKAEIDACGTAIDKAVAAHIASAPVHASMLRCEAVQGPDRCEKIGVNQYRARIQAFFVTFSEPPTALPLYPPVAAVAGFNSPTKQTLSVLNETLNMSPSAVALANDNAHLPGGPGGDGNNLGVDAAAIR